MKIVKNQSHQTVMIPTKLVRKINKVAKYLGITSEDWITERLVGQLSRFQYTVLERK